MTTAISHEVLYETLPAVLPQFLMSRRWFGGKARGIASVEVVDVVPVVRPNLEAYFLLARVLYRSGAPETYGIPLVTGTPGEEKPTATPAPLRIQSDSHEAWLFDALSEPAFLDLLLQAVIQGRSFPGKHGELRASASSALHPLLESAQGSLSPALMKAEQSNSSIVYGSHLVFKVFRRLEQGLNPDLEIGAFLTEKTSFRHAPPVAGYLEYLSKRGGRTSLGILQGFVANRGDAWKFTLNALAGYYQNPSAASLPGGHELADAPLLSLSDENIPVRVRKSIGPYLDSAELLGQRTAELHLALASVADDPDFSPEAFSRPHQRAFAASALELLRSTFELLRSQRQSLPWVGSEPERVLSLEDKVRRRFQLFEEFSMTGMRSRIHGDYHLGQVLFTGSDFVIIDFEGEPARPLEERRKKRSPLQDVAGMLRSFHYAAYAPLVGEGSAPGGSAEELRSLRQWAFYWQKWVSAAFLRSYRLTAAEASFLPRSREEFALLLDSYLLDKAVYELGYELNNRPTWIRIPLDGIVQLVGENG